MVTETGYRRRTYEEILTAKILKAKELFGENINTDENTALGKYIRINAYDQYNVEEIAEKIYYSIFPQTASGQSLDRLGWSIGISRNAAIPARYEVTVIGVSGTTVAAGDFTVSTESGITFYNTQDTVIGEDGTCTILVECVEAGSIGNVRPSDINNIVNPDAMIDSAVGTIQKQSGEDEESDYDFLKRYEVVSAGKGSCNQTSIISALTTIPTVRGAYLIVNESATETVNDVPPKTIACYVDGGADQHQAIAEAIFDKKPIGIGTYGTVIGEDGELGIPVSYGALTDYRVHFSHAENVPVYVKLALETSTEFESDGREQIKEKIQNYINSLGIGKMLVTTALYSQIYSVTGVITATVQVSTDGETYGSNNIEVVAYQCCSFEQLTINDEVVD